MVAELSRIDADLPAGTGEKTAGEIEAIAGVRAVERSEGTGGSVHLSISMQRSALSGVLAVLAANAVEHVATREPTLEDVYLRSFGDRGMRV
jgi:hypothetical protein